MVRRSRELNMSLKRGLAQAAVLPRCSALAGPTLVPAPLLYLANLPAQGDTVRLVCIAPRAYVASEFCLLRTGQALPVQTLFASEAQHSVTFVLGNITGKEAGQYRCRYRSYSGSIGQTSEFSNVVEIEEEAGTPAALSPAPTAAPAGSPWLLPVTLSVAACLLLSLGLVGAVVAVRRVSSRRQQLKRDRESCWTETNFPTTDMSFDNSLFTISVKADVEAAGSQEVCIFPASRKRLHSASSLETSNFSTFKSVQ
ncbi:protein HIDE1 [Carettochelys insculpta]|uniref:protein HIDE1 n=1 Tax=Carettochelys insculpta TaxID=44489 RepID=UPI003EBA2CDF